MGHYFLDIQCVPFVLVPYMNSKTYHKFAFPFVVRTGEVIAGFTRLLILDFHDEFIT